MLEVSIHKKSYGNKVILEEAELHIAEQGLYGVVGKNGAGKTSLFACMLGLRISKDRCYTTAHLFELSKWGLSPQSLICMTTSLWVSSTAFTPL